MRSDPLQIEITPGGNSGEVILQLTGPLTLSNLFDFQRSWREQSASFIMIDLTRVPYIDSAGIGCLVGAHVSREHSGRKLILAGAGERLHNALQVTRVDQLFTFAPDVEQARAQAGTS